MTDDAPEALSSIAGETVNRMIRIHHVLGRVIDREKGPLQLEFDSGLVLLFHVAADGEALQIGQTPWIDPFAGSLTPENEEFIRRSGKYAAFDVSKDPVYARFIGAAVDGSDPVLAPGGTVAGLLLHTSAGEIRIDVEADELFVQLG